MGAGGGGLTTTGTGGIAGAGTGGVAGGGSGGAPATGGRPGAGGGSGGSPAGTASGGSRGTGSGGGAGAGGASGAGGATGAGSSLAIVTSWPNGVILTGVRAVTSPALSQVVQVHNGGTTSLMLTGLTIGGSNPNAFQLGGAPTLPVALAAGADLAVTIQALTTGNALPAAPPQNSGGTLLTATLTASAGAVAAHANLFSLLLTTATHEPTLGQILNTLGYNLNVGAAQNNANPISPSDASKLPGVETNSAEIVAPLFVKATATGNVTLVPVARFSPMGPMPFGWYPQGDPATRNVAGTMASIPDAQTSGKARMVLSPITGPQAFDPGSAPFGIWVYTDQLSQKFDTGGIATNGDYAYSEDAPNAPPNTHRSKVYPLKDAAGTTLANQYLIAVEEAGNGDYQDYVFVLGNAKVAP